MENNTLSGGTLILTGSSSVDSSGMFVNTTTTTTGDLNWDYNYNSNEITIDSFEYQKTSDGNFIEITKRQAPMISPISNGMNFNFNPPTDRVWKEIYGIGLDESGSQGLQLIRTIEGKVTPAYSVEEEVEFE